MRKLLAALLVSAFAFSASAQVGPQTGGGSAFNPAAPGPIGGTTPAAGTFTSVTDTGLTAGRVNYNCTGGLLCDSANFTYSDATPLLCVGSGTTTSTGVCSGYSGSNGVSGIWQTGVTPTSANARIYIDSTNTVIGAIGAGIFLRPQSATTGQGIKFLGSVLSGENDGQIAVGSSALRFSSAFLGVDGLSVQGTNVATAGAVTLNQSSGSVTVAATASSVVVTDSKVAATDNIMVTPQQVDATCAFKAVVPGSGTFTITMTTACTANTRVGFFRVALTN